MEAHSSEVFVIGLTVFFLACIIGYANVPGRVAKDASALYAKNIFNFLSLIINKEDKKINLNWEDEIVNAVTLTYEGKLRLEQFN